MFKYTEETMSKVFNLLDSVTVKGVDNIMALASACQLLAENNMDNGGSQCNTKTIPTQSSTITEEMKKE